MVPQIKQLHTGCFYHYQTFLMDIAIACLPAACTYLHLIRKFDQVTNKSNEFLIWRYFVRMIIRHRQSLNCTENYIEHRASEMMHTQITTGMSFCSSNHNSLQDIHCSCPRLNTFIHAHRHTHEQAIKRMCMHFTERSKVNWMKIKTQNPIGLQLHMFFEEFYQGM